MIVLALAAATLTPAEVTIPGPQGPLAGTLTDPSRAAPAVIVIPGSGPTDRNGDNPLGVSGGIYRQLADGLAKRGIATLRIDKRGLGGSKAAVVDGNAVTIADYAGDVRGWVRMLKARGKPCAWLAGHSEGGLIALAAAQQPGGICGLILISAPGRPVGAVLRQQLKALPVADYARAEAAVVKLEAGQRVDPASLPPQLQPVFRPEVQGYLIDLLSYHPARLAAATRLPLLIVQGDADLQTSLADARALAAAQPHAKLALLPGINHVWKSASATDRAGNLATYANAALPIDPALVRTVADFIKTPR